ncbi:glutathione S-transferase [Pelistega indica]|uniref:Glutathione S-transferase n=1 Tax=Pelistega indica TaxID=1414851 RepID=V8FZL0_9BURK|nr:glutathione binding-like protein [Pelistega indica]ETD69615.1 glutathione S-transferase [Pelistega indica]
MLKLYYMPGACPLVPHVALEWAKADYTIQLVKREELKSPDFLAKNPQGSVPLLEDGDWRLAQNVAIVEYINTLYPDAHLFGQGSLKEQAKARQWLALANTDLHGSFGILFKLPFLADSEEAKEKISTVMIGRIKSIYAQVEKAVSANDYLCGNTITIGDVYFYVISRWAATLKVDLSEFTNLGAYFKRVENNAGVQKALKDQGLLG